MFNIDEYVMYGNSGVCKVAEIKKKEFVRGQVREYYFLVPLNNQSSTIYVPTDMESERLRSLSGKSFIEDAIKNAKEQPMEWVVNDNQRKDEYSKIAKSGDICQLIRLVRLLCNKRDEQEAIGKKFHVADAALLKQAKTLLFGEICFVLSCSEDEAELFIS